MSEPVAQGDGKTAERWTREKVREIAQADCPLPRHWQKVADAHNSTLPNDARYPHNPAHQCGTCAACGEEMRWNVPRMGPAGGFVHKASGKYECAPSVSPGTAANKTEAE